MNRLIDGTRVSLHGVIDNFSRRLLAHTEIRFSNSMIEAFWRSPKHQWLFLNTLDSKAAVERLVAFFVDAHNTQLPHTAFNGQTPDECSSAPTRQYRRSSPKQDSRR